MPNCKRFIPALFITFGYSCLVPFAIRIRMGTQGWHWIWNDLAFGFFMVCVFPFAVAVFCCIVEPSLIRKGCSLKSRQGMALLIFVVMVVVVGRGVFVDFNDQSRVRQPYMFKDAAKMNTLARIHDQAFSTRDFSVSTQLYRKAAVGSRGDLSTPMVWLFLICNFINVGFAVLVFCYILLAAVDGRIAERTCNHLVFVLTSLAVWFPCRAYADWHMNLTDMSWVANYAAAWVLAALLLAACLIIALRMVEGTLYHRFVIPATAVSVVFGTLAAIKPKLLSQAALALSGFDAVFLAGFALVIVATLYYISTLVHQPLPTQITDGV